MAWRVAEPAPSRMLREKYASRMSRLCRHQVVFSTVLFLQAFGNREFALGLFFLSQPGKRKSVIVMSLLISWRALDCPLQVSLCFIVLSGPVRQHADLGQSASVMRVTSEHAIEIALGFFCLPLFQRNFTKLEHGFRLLRLQRNRSFKCALRFIQFLLGHKDVAQ